MASKKIFRKEIGIETFNEDIERAKDRERCVD